MAWATPPAFAVSEIVTAARMNILSDDLAYLKGTPGVVQIDNDLTAVLAAGSTLTAQATNNATFARFRMLAKTAGGAAIDWRMIADPSGDFYFYDGAASQFRLALTATNGYLGVRTQTPQGALHVAGPGGGVMFLSHNAVAGTIETLAVAGTVTLMAIMWGMIRNNGGSTLSFIGLVSANTFMLGTTLVVNCNTAADQVTITITAGGAVTAQRTNGSNSHAVNLWVVYK